MSVLVDDARIASSSLRDTASPAHPWPNKPRADFVSLGMNRFAGLSLLFWIGAALAQPDLVVLTGTGETREGLPVLTRHPDGEAIREALSPGFPGRMVRLYGLVQRFRLAREGVPVEPAYLYLSENQGGFPRYGFHLNDVAKPGVAYVDLHKSSPITGRYGAVDQIFPHELGHVLIRQLIGELGDGGANQIHATALRTDRIVAFNEGFAEHFQIMTLEDPEAPSETARLKDDPSIRAQAAANLGAYRRALEARWSAGAPARMRFLFWFSSTEDVLRHHWVLANAFARRPWKDDRPPVDDLYKAYLLEGVLPGEPDDPAKPASILVSTEGVVSALFYRWMSHPKLRQMPPDPSFFEGFTTSPERLDPLERAYLKLFFVFATEKPHDAIAVVRGYRRAFPAEAAALDELTDDIFLGQPLTEAPEIWLANPDFKTGTTLFDQYRGLPRTHTFDLNAASTVDLMGVPGTSREVAENIRRAAPLATLDQLRAVEGIDSQLFERYRRMADAMRELRASQEEEEADLSIESILMPYLWRAFGILGLCWLAAAPLYRAARKVRWWRAAINGLAASLVVLSAAWVLGAPDWASVLAPLALFGAPAGAWAAIRGRRPGPALRVFAAWLAAVLPAAASIQTWL